VKFAKHWGCVYDEDCGNFFNTYFYTPFSTISVNKMIEMHNQGVGSPNKVRYGAYTTNNTEERMKVRQQDRLVRQVKAQWDKKKRTFVVQSNTVEFFDDSIGDLIGAAEDTVKNLIIELDTGKPY
jgi:predicted N-acyltransferase